MAPRAVEFAPAEAADAAVGGGDAPSSAKCCGMENDDDGDDDIVCEAVNTFDDDNDDDDAAEDRNAVDWNAENDGPLAPALGEELGKDGEDTMRCDSCGDGDADGVSLRLGGVAAAMTETVESAARHRDETIAGERRDGVGAISCCRACCESECAAADTCGGEP